MSKKQRDLVSKLKAGWKIKSTFIGSKTKVWVYKENEVPELISYITLASLRSKGYIKKVPSERFDERCFEYNKAGEINELRNKELAKLGVPAFS